jgi:SH3-like domain-containing protein
MKRRICVLWIGVFVLSLLLSISAEASEADVELLIMDPDPKGANVRAAPENGKIIRTIPLNPPNKVFRKVRVTEQQGRWFAVELADGTKGWMHDSTLGSVSRENAVLKAEPQRDAAEVAKVPDGKYLTLSAVQRNWAKVTYTDEKKVKHTGWLTQAQLETDPRKIPVFVAPKPEVIRASGSLDLQVMEKNRNTQEVTNVRDKPSGKVIASILRHPLDPEMRGVHVTKQEGTWFAVELKDGTKGWMHSSVLGCFAAASAEGEALLFSKPDDKAVTNTRIPEDTPLFLTGIQGTWAKIAYTDKKGKKVEGWLPSRSQWLDYDW